MSDTKKKSTKTKELTLDQIDESLKKLTRTEQLTFLENWTIWLDGELAKDAAIAQEQLENVQKFKALTHKGTHQR